MAIRPIGSYSMNPNSIKDCPFCDSSQTFLKEPSPLTFTVECLICKARGPGEDDEDMAVASWNDR